MDTHGRPARLLACLTVAPALLLVAWLAVGLPLLFAGAFRLGPVCALFLPLAAIVLWLGCRGTRRHDAVQHDAEPTGGPADAWSRREPPYGPQRPRAEDSTDSTDSTRQVSWWVVAGVLAVTAGFLALQLVMCSEQIIVRRDPASYVQFATWLTDHGSLPIPQMRWAFGGADRSLGYDSPAFFARGGVLVPQFMAGLPMILTAGGWLGGTYTLLAMSPVLGACAVLSFGGLVARLIGPRWAPAGALALALTLPMMFVSRSTYSEVPALVLLLGGLCLIHDARHGQARIRAALGGAALGLIILVRIDGLRDILPVVLVAGLLVARRRSTGLPLFLGLAAGAGAGLTEGYAMSRPYLDYLHDSLDPLLLMAVATVLMTVVMVALLRWPRTGRPLRRLGVWAGHGRLPGLAALATVLMVLAFAVRPYLQTTTRKPVTYDDRLNAAFIKAVQLVNGLPARPDRTYSEISLYWVVWYIGVPALLLATFGAVLLVRRLLRRRAPEWVLPYVMIVWTTVTTLLRPGITPDHPWASRRLVSVVIPGLILLAMWALAWVVRRVRQVGYSGPVTAVVGGCGVIVLIVPMVAVSAGLMLAKTEQGEVTAVRGLCRQLGSDASVVIVERVTADRFTQVIRGMCGVPVARTPARDQVAARRVIDRIIVAGRRPVMLGANASDVAPYGPARQVVQVATRQDEHTLVTPPAGTWSLTINVWLAEAG